MPRTRNSDRLEVCASAKSDGVGPLRGRRLRRDDPRRSTAVDRETPKPPSRSDIAAGRYALKERKCAAGIPHASQLGFKECCP
jgi:hypothetical protein